jgi:AcrR family transcriptional regulator
MSTEIANDPTTRQALLREAAALFAVRGYDAVSVREIVEAAGCTKPAMYYHFGSKDGLALALFAEFTEAALAARDRAFASADSPQDAFVCYAREMLKLARPFRNTLAFGFSIWFGRTSLKELVAQVKETDEKAYLAWTEALTRLGLPERVAVTATRAFWALLLHELMQAVACPRWEGDPERLSQQIAAIVMHGVLSLETVEKRE